MHKDVLKAEIQNLKQQKNAAILAHYYQDDDIQEIADFVGDSYFLAKKGQELSHDVIVMCGVVFMGESVKLLNPQKTVLVPDLEAGCSLVSGAPYTKYLAWRKLYPDALAVTYVNSSAEVKAISDIVCTSSNAAKIIASIPPDRQILFGPDRNLGHWLQTKLNRPLTLWNGACEVHVKFSLKNLVELMTLYPQAMVLAHPECLPEILELADVIGSTSQLLESVTTPGTQQFIVVTEPGIIYQMKKLNPTAEYFAAPGLANCACNDCPYMRLNTLSKLHRALVDLSPSVSVPEATIARAQLALQRMMDVSSGKSIEWPSTFVDPLL